MDDPRETRRIASNWREYLDESAESFRVYAWAWREFVTDGSKKWMKRAVGALLVGSLLMLLQPWLVRGVIDGLIAKDANAVLYALAGVVAVMLADRLLMWAFDHWREYSLGINQGSIDNRSSALFFGKSLGQHIRDDGMLTASNVEKGRNRVLDTQSMFIFEGVPTLMRLLLAFVFLLAISPAVGLAMFGLLAVYVAFMLFINTKVLQVCTPLDAEFRRLNRHRYERWDNIERVKTSGKADEEVDEMTSRFDDLIARDRKFWHWAIRMFALRGTINTMVVAGTMVYGAWCVWNGAWTVGLLYPIYQWVSSIADNLWRISHIEHRLNWTMPSVRSMKIALTQPSDVVDVPDAVDLPADRTPRIALEAVGHAYGGAMKDAGSLHVLRDVGFTIEPGAKVALIGPSGAGKTTVMRLLQRYMDPEKGRVLVDGTDLRNVRLASWTRLIGYIPQQAQVLDGTLRYNLLYGLPKEEAAKVTDDELWSIMHKLQIDFGARLTTGLDTIVGRRGIKLSGGQAQRLMIGAAVMKGPRFMIVDEATSSLDSTTEKAVQEGLRQVLLPETSALIIAHRLSTVRHLCGTFVVLRQAEDIPDGENQVEAVAHSFEELYARSPTFRRLADDQGVVVGKRRGGGQPVPAPRSPAPC